MNNANDITKELESLGSVLAGLPRIMPYSVPANYFQSLTDELQKAAVTDQMEEPQPDWSKAMPYGIPEGYFEQLPGRITAAAKRHPNIFEVPAGYFNALPQQVLAAAKATDAPVKHSKIIDLVQFSRVRWVAAAVLLICVGFGSYQLYMRPATNNPEQILASVPGNDIHEYLTHHYRVDVDQVVGSDHLKNIPLDNKDIIQYLDETGWDVVD